MLVNKDRTAAAIAATFFVFVAAIGSIKSIVDFFECRHKKQIRFVLATQLKQGLKQLIKLPQIFIIGIKTKYLGNMCVWNKKMTTCWSNSRKFLAR